MNLFRYKSLLPLFLLVVTGHIASARGKHLATGEIPKIQKTDGLDFIENKGQWVPEARFKAAIPGGALFVTNSGFVYNYISLNDLEHIHELTHTAKGDLSGEIVHTHAYRVNFVGGNTNVSYEQSAKRNYYNNFFIGNDPSKWAGNVGLYGKVIQKNIYPGVDVALYGKDKSFKYDFIVAPGADAGKIKLSFEGVTPVLTSNGNLKFTTSVNVLEEQAPYCYQVINGIKKEVKSSYKLVDGVLTYSFPEGYNNQYELIIDPVLVFSTYSGSTTSAYSHTTTYDADGNLYAGAYVTGVGWPATLGAAQGTNGGLSDAGINKYNATGTALVYSTYYGGSSSEYPHSMFVNSLGELILSGITNSSNIPLTGNAFDNTLGGNSDIFVVHFNSTGTALIGATYLGGSSNEPSTVDINGTSSSGNSLNNLVSPVELNVDNSGNIWVVSNTVSTDFPVSANAQQALSGGANDGVICKLNPTCSQLLYSSYLGGSGTDAILGIQFNHVGNVVVCGSTQSTNFPTTTGAMTTTAPGGTCDGFVTIINSATGAIMHSTYTGTTGTDQAVNLQIDATNNVYVLGRTDGAYPISTGVYSMAGSDCFIDKLTPTLSASLSSTRVGGQQTGSRYFPTAFLLDICQNIYVAGLSQSTGSYITGLPTTTNAFDNTPRSFWFCVLSPNFGTPLMQSYFGSNNPTQNYYDHTHVGVNRMDPGGVIYHSVCANAPTGSFPTTPGSVFPTKLNSGQDILSFKFNFEATGVQSNFVLDPTLNQNDTGCAPYTVHFKNTSTSAKVYTWNFGDNTPTSNDTNVVHTFTNPGVYTVALYANNDSSCITDDTAYMTITVLYTALPDLTVNDTTLCTFQQSINIGVTINNPTANNTIQWGPGAGIIGAANTPTITVDPSTNNTYWVTVKDTIPGICGFSKTDTVHIDLSPRVLDILNNDTVVCKGAVVPISALGTAGYTYAWSPSTGVSDTTLLQPVITINQPNVYTLTASYPDCPDTAVQISFGMHYIPTLDLGPDKSVCQWTEVALESTVSPFRNDYIYQWSPATPNLTNPTGPNTSFISDTTITYILHVQTPIGCADQDTISITVYPGGFGAIIADTGYCPGNAAPLWATGGVSYAWSPAYGLSDTTIPNPVASPLTTTDYTLLIKDIHNCLDTEKVTVQVYPQAVLTLPDSITVYPGEQYHVEPGTNCLYFSWFPPSGLSNASISDPLMSPQVRTRYFVNATTENGCVVKDSMDVLVKETVIDMPNAFAPAGTNNLFKPAKRGIVQLKNFSIFNRWGNKVYSSTNIEQGWDGTKDGKAVPAGVYVYIIEAVTDNGKVFTQQGNVTLIR